MYQIIGVYRGKTEILDEVDTKKEAYILAYEYGVAFGYEWEIRVE